MFSYFRQSACIMRFIIFIYDTQILIPAISDHKFLKSLETTHSNATPLGFSPEDCSEEARRRFNQCFRSRA